MNDKSNTINIVVKVETIEETVCGQGLFLELVHSHHKSPKLMDGVTWKPSIVTLKKANDGLTRYVQKTQLVIWFEIRNEIEGQVHQAKNQQISWQCEDAIWVQIWKS